MSLKPTTCGISRRTLLMTGALLPIAAPATAQAPLPTAAGFSFAAVGDTRPMMYLPLKEGQPDLNKFFVEMFGLVMPEKVAEAVVARDVKMIFDPATKELIKVVMPFESKTEVMTLTVDKGWVTEASVEDVKLLPGVHRTMFRLQGGEWVTREIVKDVQSGRAKFVVNSGDVVWWGNQGLTVNDSPYWKRVNDTMLKKLPAPDDEMRAAGLDGRFFMSVGNHEVWADPKIEGVLSAVPYLKKFGVTPENLIYKFDFKGTRFIYLWSGKYDYRSPSLWDADRPKYAEQMTQLQKWMDEAKANGIRKAFIVFHYPVFARSGLGPICAIRNGQTTEQCIATARSAAASPERTSADLRPARAPLPLPGVPPARDPGATAALPRAALRATTDRARESGRRATPTASGCRSPPAPRPP